ncbi:MAG: chitobiase/beta-hexosaminidase C-terminal domain-containing protein [Muribaculaceae bacterium]|nr:chitobiase/beta-hexosaminidase C-terminal domain-containing protein [Muribaculaceae bacterium]
MKKLLLFFATLLCVSSAYAEQEAYEWYVTGNKKFETIPSNSSFFTVKKGDGDMSYADKYGSCTFLTLSGKSVTSTYGLKMESASTISWSTSRPSKLIIVQGTGSSFKDDTIKLDDNVISATANENPGDGYTNAKVYTIENIKAGDHKLTRGSNEFGLFYFAVILDELKGVQLSAPTINADASGNVTISKPENATKVVYTTDGKTPDENSTEYTASFKVEDGTVVKALAIGDGSSYANSEVTTETVYIANGTVATPTVGQFNGTFALTCSTPKAKIEYSLDGTSYVEYTMPVTLTESTSVKVRATRDGWTAAETTVEVTALPSVKKSKTIYIGAGSFASDKTNVKVDEKNTLVGVEGDESKAYGFNIQMGGDGSKEFGSGNKIAVPELGEGQTRTGIKGSNGVENSLIIPEGLMVNRITFYSYPEDGSRVSGWSSVNGVEYNDYANVPMGSTAATSSTSPDIRIFNFDGATGKITFKSSGERVIYVLAVDIIEEKDVPAAPTAKVDGVEVSDGIDVSDGKKKVTFEAADENHVVYAAFVGEVSAAAEEEGMTHEKAPEGTKFTKVDKDGFEVSEKGTLYYFAHDPANDVKGELRSIAVTGTTAIDGIDVDANAPVEYFNLQGVRVANPENGIFIRRQGDKVSKVVVR